MNCWNQWSEEVSKERSIVRDYGLGKAPRHADTYKAQALRLLAEKQLMEERIRDLEFRINAAVDMLDGADPSKIAQAIGMSENMANGFMERILRA
jgi:hypothetical protein